MIGDQLRIEVLEWIKNDPDKNTADQLNRWLEEGNEKELNRCFNGFLQFGTAGLRGPVGPGRPTSSAVWIKSAFNMLERIRWLENSLLYS